MVAEPEPAGREVVVGVLADPDLPAVIGERLADGLPDLLPERIDDVALRWRVEVVQDPFEALSPDYGRLVDKARERVRATSWDMAVCVTDAPLRNGHGVVLAEVGAKDALAVLSLPPALGGGGPEPPGPPDRRVPGRAPGPGRGVPGSTPEPAARAGTPAQDPHPAGRGPRGLRHQQRGRGRGPVRASRGWSARTGRGAWCGGCPGRWAVRWPAARSASSTPTSGTWPTRCRCHGCCRCPRRTGRWPGRHPNRCACRWRPGGFRLDDIGLEVDERVEERYRSCGDDYDSVRGEVVSRVRFGRADWEASAVTRTVMTSDAQDFHLHAELDAYHGSERVLSLNWSTSIPRDCV